MERVKNGMQLLQVLLICSLEDALQTADSMQARGFGVTKRTTYIRYRMERRDWYTLSYLSILFIIAIICSTYGGGKLIIYPKVESILFQQYDGMMFIVFTMFISLPIIMEGRGMDMVAHAEIKIYHLYMLMKTKKRYSIFLLFKKESLLHLPADQDPGRRLY